MATSIDDLPCLTDEERAALDDSYIAMEGVPEAVTASCACPHCKGSGIDPGEGHRCELCEGSGTSPTAVMPPVAEDSSAPVRPRYLRLASLVAVIVTALGLTA